MARRIHSQRYPAWTYKLLLTSVIVGLLHCGPEAIAQQRQNQTANYRQAEQYSSAYLRQFVYDTAVRPNWIGESDEFWYVYRTSNGTRYQRVNPQRASKTPLFDHVKLAAQLTEFSKRPADADQLDLSRVEVDATGTTLTFVAHEMQYEYSLLSDVLKQIGPAPRQTPGNFGRGGRGGQQERERNLQEFERQRRQQEEEQQQNDEERGEESAAARTRERNAHRVFSPDRRAYVFAKGHNLYFVELPKDDESPLPAEGSKSQAAAEDAVENAALQESNDQQGDSKQDGVTLLSRTAAKFAQQAAFQVVAELPIPNISAAMDETAIALTSDGAESYSFAGRPGGVGRGRGQQAQRSSENPIGDDTKTRPNVTWSKDSKSFFVSRSDSRGVKELWVINSLADPRPTLESYPYPMPGEENIRKSELYYFWRDAKSLQRVESKWKDEGYSQPHYGKSGEELRFLRRDRLLRNIEFCALNTSTGQATGLLSEGFENAHIAPQPHRYLDETDEMIWWSERSGWGHFYLYDRDGKFKNAITSGNYLASRIVDVDIKNREMYFVASGREPGENVYYQHLYVVRLDGTGLRLLDPGDANHASTLSPSKQFLVDNYSRVDLAPTSVLRKSDGSPLLDLEVSDLSRLEQVGWKMPETFVVKAADGVTDLYGNLFKPFDFDPRKKYPIVVHVYPGPQQEGTRHTFSATSGEQQLAQLGLIVVQVGHRGGSPGRSKAYGSFGYSNLRDYGLADKKAALEQLAQRHAFIDIERVGIYGHSGGGFMTAAALLVPPYNDFFKVGVSTAGNHDNNIYNNSWSERYHGLKLVAVDQNESSSEQGRLASAARDSGQSNPQVDADGQFDVDPTDFFYSYEMMNDEDQWDLDRRFLAFDPFDSSSMFWQDEVQERQQQQVEGERRQDGQSGERQEQGERRGRRGGGGGQGRQSGTGERQEDSQQDGGEQTEQGKKETEYRFEIRVPTTVEMAANLKGHLMLIHGEADNNVHPANTLRLVDALIKANKRFDMLYLPNTRHGFGAYQPYVTQRMFEYFAEHLLNDQQNGPDLLQKSN